MTAICLACSLLAAAAGSLFDQGHMDKLNALISGGKIQEAMDLLDRMETEANQLKADHGRFYVRWKRAWCLAQVDDSEKAQEMLESVIKDAAGEFGETYGFLPLMHHNLGEMYLRHRQMELAAEHLDAALDLVDKAVVPGSNPKRPMPIDDTVRLHIQFLRAECFTFRGENEKAREKMEALDQRVTAALKAGRDNGEKADPFLVQLAVEIGVQLAELDRRNSDVPGAVGRLQRCLDELQSDESVAALELRFKCHVLLANVYWETGRFGDAGEELNRADQAVPEKNILDTRDLAIARANLQVEQVASVLESRLEKMATLDRLTEAENAAREALEDCKKADAGPNSFTAIAAYQLAQVRGLRGRAFDARGRNEDARKAFDAALGDCDDALALPESVFPKDHDFVLQVRRYRAWVNLQRGDVDAARKEAEDALKLFVKRHSEDNVDCELFHGVLLEVEEKAENAEAAAGHAEAHRRLAIRRLPYLASLTAPAQVEFFQDYDEPGLHGGLRLGIRFPSVRDRSAEWLLNGKAKIADAAALVYREARGGKEALALQDIVQQQAYLLYGPPDADRDGAKLGQLEAKKRDLAVRQAAKLANNRDAAELARPVRLADLQAKLRPEEIYIDVCCLRPEMNAPRAYYAWIVTAADPVEVRKLGNADEIDGLVKTLQDHMENCGGEHGLAATVGLRERPRGPSADQPGPSLRASFTASFAADEGEEALDRQSGWASLERSVGRADPAGKRPIRRRGLHVPLCDFRPRPVAADAGRRPTGRALDPGRPGLQPSPQGRPRQAAPGRVSPSGPEGRPGRGRPGGRMSQAFLSGQAAGANRRRCDEGGVPRPDPAAARRVSGDPRRLFSPPLVSGGGRAAGRSPALLRHRLRRL